MFDETVAANPEEIELDDNDAEAADEGAQEAKQELADDTGMFYAHSMHNYNSSIGTGPDVLTQRLEHTHSQSNSHSSAASATSAPQAPAGVSAHA